MNRIDRLSAILIQLQSKKVVKAQEIADRFDISLRTVYRDLRALEGAGVPIGAEAGIGYFLLAGYSLPPLKFSKEEAGALLLAAKLAEWQTDKSIRKYLNDALLKIRAALKMEEKEYLEQIENNIEVLHLPDKPNASNFPDHFLSDIQTALAQKRVINFDYYSPHSDAFTNRNVEPLSLCFYARHWHLMAYCQLRKGVRDFRSDRIMKLTVTSQHFDEQAHPEYKSYLDNMMSQSDLQQVRVRFSLKVARYISEQRYFMGYVDSKVTPKHEEMLFMTMDLDSFAHWLLQFVDEVEVDEPAMLKLNLQQLTARAHTHYHQ